MAHVLPGGSAAVLTANGSIAGTTGFVSVAAFGLSTSAASGMVTLWDSSSPTANPKWTLIAASTQSVFAYFDRAIICGSGISISMSGTGASAFVNWW